jgi:hypothetical protein
MGWQKGNGIGGERGNVENILTNYESSGQF